MGGSAPRREQVIAAARAHKHVFCEKPFALTAAEAQDAVDAAQQAGITLGLGYNRRFHPEMTKLRNRIRSGDLGVIMHAEATMTFPNALLLKADAWRAQKDETPCGGLTPMGVHAIDGMIDLCGEIETVFCQSFRRAVAVARRAIEIGLTDHQIGERLAVLASNFEVARVRRARVAAIVVRAAAVA